MLSIKVILSVKFRAFGITFGTLDKTFVEPLPISIPTTIPIGLPKTLIKYNDRGVNLTVVLQNTDLLASRQHTQMETDLPTTGG